MGQGLIHKSSRRSHLRYSRVIIVILSIDRSILGARVGLRAEGKLQAAGVKKSN